MFESHNHFEFGEENAHDLPVEPGGRFISILRRIVLGLLVLIVILGMLSNLIALPDTASPPIRSDLGLTEAEIIDRYGPPDERSQIQVVGEEGAIGLTPRRLNEGDRYFSITYEEGPLILVFHFVSPGTYQKYNAYRSDSSNWVVLERFIGTSNVLY
jgi:hypothetical protein